MRGSHALLCQPPTDNAARPQPPTDSGPALGLHCQPLGARKPPGRACCPTRLEQGLMVAAQRGRAGTASRRSGSCGPSSTLSKSAQAINLYYRKKVGRPPSAQAAGPPHGSPQSPDFL
ncbi:hypothetical protein QTO34_019140 [Cnephaeus nilssonii]|uniref:Uncharacterized protein n=1 Tax=Cnephaeus nilssonii TaxID=3371016 RepID=A0AA40I040_CNENI|nr:hypothetical protein QTO34_019140 [Eptesicus nilssonii]